MAEDFEVHRPEREQALAKTALALMGECNVIPTPENFELFYAYATGENPPVAQVIGQMIAEASGGSIAGPQMPVCDHVYKVKQSRNIWEQVVNLSEAVCEKCGQPVMEKHLGFKKLKNKLDHKKGVTDPAALAASIGRKKYGVAGMAKKAAAGRKK